MAVGGWWYWRNWRLYGDPLGLQAMFAVLPRRAEPPTWAELLARAQGVWRSCWAVFGWFNVVADEWFYHVYTILSLLGLAGLLICPLVNPPTRRLAHSLTRSPADSQTRKPADSPTRTLLLLALWLMLIVIALVQWAQMRYPQGRLLFPAISAFAVLLSAGLHIWIPRRWRGTFATLLISGLFGLAAFAPWRWIAPAYAAPALLPPNAKVPNPLAAEFEGQIRLVGYEMDTTALRPGQTLQLTLYWKALRPPDRDYSVFIHLVDEVGIIQAQRDSYPASGALPTTEWPVGPIIPDQHSIQIPETAIAPARLRVDVGLYHFADGIRLSVGEQDHLTLGYIQLLPRVTERGLPNPIFINFEDQIALVGFQLDRRVMRPGEALTLTLWWEALTAPQKDYVVFTHLVFPPDAVWAQVDAMPQGGAAPTSTWETGRLIKDTYQLRLPDDAPPGIYFIEVGLYDPRTLDRLKTNFTDQRIVLGYVKIIEHATDS
ncbi:MAG TPA: hypothetical protein G4O02_08005 [Caldilineae bacterium]|nr:hypothetical protein [Caldilineae bacterium]